MTTTTDTTTAPAAVHSAQNAEWLDSVRSALNFLDANPELVDAVRAVNYNFLVPLGSVEERAKPRMAAWIRAGLAAKLPIRKEYDSSWDNTFLDFGPFAIQVYASREAVCERVVTGTREVTREVPDPEALKAVPTVTVTETEDVVEWVCAPLLADTPATNSQQPTYTDLGGTGSWCATGTHATTCTCSVAPGSVTA